MPEGHTIHRLARDMQELVANPVTATSPQGKFLDAGAVSGQECSSVSAHGKHLFIGFHAAAVHVHLGMRGKWLRFSPVTGDALKQVRLRLSTEDLAWDLIAPSTCELLAPERVEALLAKLGPDPLRDGADVDVAIRNLSRYTGSIGAALMDQSVVSGVGNVFRAEALHACRIDPQRPASSVDEAELAVLWKTLQVMMAQAVDDGRIITVDSEDRLSVPEAESRRVYKQERCYDCGTAVSQTNIEGRTSYSCPRCQPA